MILSAVKIPENIALVSHTVFYSLSMLEQTKTRKFNAGRENKENKKAMFSVFFFCHFVGKV